MGVHRFETHTPVEKWELTSPEIGLTYLHISLILKAAGRMHPSLAQRSFHRPQFSKCITSTHTHTHTESESKTWKSVQNTWTTRLSGRVKENKKWVVHLSAELESTLLCHIVSALPRRYYSVETVVMVIRSLACSCVTRDLHWADTISNAVCARGGGVLCWWNVTFITNCFVS